jgi:hypothetical protein
VAAVDLKLLSRMHFQMLVIHSQDSLRKFGYERPLRRHQDHVKYHQPEESISIFPDFAYAQIFVKVRLQCKIQLAFCCCCFFGFFLAVLGIKFKAYSLLGKCSTTQTMPPGPFCFLFFI